MNTPTLPRYSERAVLALLQDYATEDSWVNRQLGAQIVQAQLLHSLAHVITRLLSDRSEWVRLHALQAILVLDVPQEQKTIHAVKLEKDSFFRVRQLAKAYLHNELDRTAG
jgi:hypothetical protein